MALDTYDGLKASIESWLWNRTDLTATIPDFIRLAEAQMIRALNVREMEKTAFLYAVEGEAPLPCDFAEVRALRQPGDVRSEIRAVPLSVIRERRDQDNARVMEYAVGGSTLYVWPRADAELTLDYRARFPHLSADNPENWLLAKHPDAYLYGSLMQAAPFLQEDERIATWGTLYSAALDAINRDGRRARIGAQVAMQPNGVVI